MILTFYLKVIFENITAELDFYCWDIRSIAQTTQGNKAGKTVRKVFGVEEEKMVLIKKAATAFMFTTCVNITKGPRT